MNLKKEPKTVADGRHPMRIIPTLKAQQEPMQRALQAGRSLRYVWSHRIHLFYNALGHQ